MSYKICPYLLTTILHVCLSYAGYCGEGSGKDTKEFFIGLGVRGKENCLGDVK